MSTGLPDSSVTLTRSAIRFIALPRSTSAAATLIWLLSASCWASRSGATPICSACRVTYADSSAGSTPRSSLRASWSRTKLTLTARWARCSMSASNCSAVWFVISR